jgi:hypothetical protein
MSAEVLPFPGNPGAPIQPIVPRSEFGQRRQIESLAGCLEGVKDALVRPEDRTAQQRIKALAREARNAFDKAHVDPSLRAELAAKVGVIAELCERAAAEAKFLGELRAAVTLREHQGLLETLSAELVP